MGDKQAPNFTAHAVIGSLLIFNTLVLGIAPAGPWDSTSFSVGIIGLIGLSLWYIAWYRFTFERKGLIPWLDQWKDLAGTAPKVVGIGILTLAMSWYIGNYHQANLPEPTGLVLLLIGSLISLSGIYAILVAGPLADTQLEE
tara:strand:- start:43863 stop:44288 length:426 start_codon:yes stop_codon:yes gene_type:complete